MLYILHSSEWVFRPIFSQSYDNIWLFCYTSCKWLCPTTRKIQLLKTFFYNRIKLGLHPSLYINSISTHYHLHFMLLNCVNLSISIQQVHKDFFSFFSNTSGLTTEFKKQHENHGSSIFLCSCCCTAPNLGKITYKSIVVVAPNAALSIANVIWVVKLFLLIAITIVPCVTYGISLWRLITSHSSNSGNPMATSSPGIESPSTKPTTILTCFLLSLFCVGFVVQASL